MPHYKDGTPANVGDYVRGKGYNVTDKDGRLKEIVGRIVHISPGQITCNIQVAYIATIRVPDGTKFPDPRFWPTRAGVKFSHGADGQPLDAFWLDVEYGQCDNFEKVG